jgi:ligand-binding SRPBCC domain-containing protein
MPKLEFSIELDTPMERVWAFYDSVDALLAITPPTTRVCIAQPPAHIAEGVHFTLIVSQPPIYIPLFWETYITVYEPPYLFVDEQGRGPFKSWRHEHRFEALPEGRTRVRDTISYIPPFGRLGVIADHLFIRRQLESMFAFRYRATRSALSTSIERDESSTE